MKRFFIFLTFFVCSVAVQAQSFDVNKLKVQWEVVENNHKGASQFLSAFTLTNTSTVDFPASGWTLYFNFIRHVSLPSVTGNTGIERVNGDLFKLYPTEKFQGIKAGQSLRIEFASSDWVVNFTDAPAGLYLVWSASPDKGTAITNYTVKQSTEPKQYLRFPGDKIGLITPQILFDQNKIITPVSPDQLRKVFPSPVRYTKTEGTFLLDAAVEIVTDPVFQREATYLANELATVLGKKPTVVTTPSGKKAIVLKKSDMTSEAYTLQIKPSGITIAASDPAGAFYGIQSLKIVLPADAWAKVKPSLTLPALDIEDAPRFGHRAFMLDVVRNFHSKQEVLKIIDLLSLYKLNVFHFHFSDDEGWRIEIPSLPELTQVGAQRGHAADLKNSTVPSFGSGPSVQSKAGTGFYTRADYIDILKYATERHVKVIPEIEIPGHARAAILSMNARYERLSKEGKQKEAEEFLLRDLQDESKYRSVQGWDDNVVNVALPSTYRFVEKVMDELIAMHKDAGAPLETIHVGGDEVPAGVWQKSPAAQKLMAENPAVKSTDDLWYYFYGKVSELLKKRGLFTYGWEEIAMRKTKLDGKNHFIPNPDFVSEQFQVDVWNNDLGGGQEDLAYRLANAGYKVVLSAVTNLYFDMAYYKDFNEPGYYWGAFVDTDKPYYFIPYDYFKNAKEDKFGVPVDPSLFTGKQRLTDYGKSNIVGVQGLIWSENMISPERLEYMMLPKLLALAERAWAQDPAWATEKDPEKSTQLYNAAWSDFVSTLGNQELPRLDYYQNGFNYRIPSPGATVEQGKVIANIQFPGLTIRYTTDGSEPTVKSPVYTGPLPNKGVIKLRAFNKKGRGGNTTIVSKSLGLYD